MCCGQKRAELRSSPATAKTTPNSQGTLLQTVSPGTYAPPTPQTVQRFAPAQAPPASASAVPDPAISSSNGSVMVRYVEQSPIRVQGLKTGRSYEFSGTHSIQAVDARDAATLLATRFFR